MSKTKDLRRIRNTEILREQCNIHSLKLLELNEIHMRIIGEFVTVDYWPSTGRAWVVGSRDKASKVRIADLMAIASSTASIAAESDLDADALSHMGSILSS